MRCTYICTHFSKFLSHKRNQLTGQQVDLRIDADESLEHIYLTKNPTLPPRFVFRSERAIFVPLQSFKGVFNILSIRKKLKPELQKKPIDSSTSGPAYRCRRITVTYLTKNPNPDRRERFVKLKSFTKVFLTSYR